jgi:uncharacterized protein YihD (DUF1040 family)
MTKKVNVKENETDVNYGFYSKVLNKPFDSLSELREAEAIYYAEQQAKEDKAAQKKADAHKVEDAFKGLNAARKEYKEKLTQLTKEYSEELATLKQAFELGKKNIQDELAAAEDNYSNALKAFTDKYDSYHFTMRDGDFETTISGSQTKTEKNDKKANSDLLNLFDLLFNF